MGGSCDGALSRSVPVCGLKGWSDVSVFVEYLSFVDAHEPV